MKLQTIINSLLSKIFCEEVIRGYKNNGFKGAVAGAKIVRGKRSKILDDVNDELLGNNSIKHVKPHHQNK